DEALFYDEIDSICVWPLHAFVQDWQPHLVLNMQTTRGQFVEQAGTNGAFKHPRPEGAVNLQGAADHSMTRLVRSHVTSIRLALCRHRGQILIGVRAPGGPIVCIVVPGPTRPILCVLCILCVLVDDYSWKHRLYRA